MIFFLAKFTTLENNKYGAKSREILLEILIFFFFFQAIRSWIFTIFLFACVIHPKAHFPPGHICRSKMFVLGRGHLGAKRIGRYKNVSFLLLWPLPKFSLKLKTYNGS
uniref:Uncharacterized protein n=1 Tax=Cacopsylla melanoneura TaxID=428564 RepID=A0A8D9EMJ6_9HEMI